MTFPTLRAIKAVLTSMVLAIAAGIAMPALAQSPFQTVLTVNQLAITQYELDQRELILRVLRSPGDPSVEARKSLIDDRLRATAIRDAGVSLSQEEIQEGITEFASRANRGAEEFIAALNQEGIATDRDSQADRQRGHSRRSCHAHSRACEAGVCGCHQRQAHAKHHS